MALGDRQELEPKLKLLVAQNHLQNSTVGLDAMDRVRGFKVSNTSDVTVVVFGYTIARHCYTFVDGEFDEAAWDRMQADIVKLLPRKPKEVR